jgi:demethoxyubiquinone hydroxylase (CLK1/Coq7/Cat5 family)
MRLVARLNARETLGDRVMKVDHAGEHGAVCIYLAQRWAARLRALVIAANVFGFVWSYVRKRKA